ncbi:MAG: MBL fold metallo-hydrolase, partial [Candidatus Eisenbacteria bacterium]
MKPRRAVQTTTDEDSRGALAWAILFYLQGRTDESREALKGALARDHFASWGKNIAWRLQDCIDPAQPREPGSDPERSRLALSLALVKTLDDTLCPDSAFSPCYADESRYSRDPFAAPGRPDRRRDLALAAVLHLLRGHVAFRCRPKGLRDFNAAKVSLNDYFQCGQLAWRLYRALPTCHGRRGSQQDYLAKVVEKCDPRPFLAGPTGGGPAGTPQHMPEESEYFVWSTLLLLSIERGFVYREIDNLAESARFFRQMQRRLERLERALGSGLLADAATGGRLGPAWSLLVTPTVVEGLSEMSKVLFDGGFLLESLSHLTSCLAYLVKGTPTPAGSTEAVERRELVDDCLAALRFLEAERHQSIVNAQLVCAWFGWDAPATPGRTGLPPGVRPVSPERFTQHVARSSLNFAFDLLARAGYILYTLCRGCIVGADPRAAEMRGWLRRYFSAHEAVGPLDPGLLPSRLGAHCISLIGEAAAPDPKTHPRWEEPERELAGCLRAARTPESAEGEDLTRGSFFEAILRAATENIHNIVTIPARNRKLLMRRGYRFRREQGDLSRATVAKGIRAALHGLLEPDEDLKGGRAEEHLPNKLVVLRRWQSFAPRIPRQGGERLRGGGYYLLWHGRGIVIDPGYDFIENFYDEGFSLADVHAVIVTHSHPDHDDDLSSLTTLIHEWNAYHELMGR